jgi:hypothetical protein
MKQVVFCLADVPLMQGLKHKVIANWGRITDIYWFLQILLYFLWDNVIIKKIDLKKGENTI